MELAELWYTNNINRKVTRTHKCHVDDAPAARQGNNTQLKIKSRFK